MEVAATRRGVPFLAPSAGVDGGSGAEPLSSFTLSLTALSLPLRYFLTPPNKDSTIQRELRRHRKRKERLSDRQLSELQPQNLKQVLESAPEMGTMSIRTNRLDLNSHQVYRPISNVRRSRSFTECTAANMDFDASYMSNRTSQEAWLFLNHLSTTIAMECIADIARLGKDNTCRLKTCGKLLEKS